MLRLPSWIRIPVNALLYSNTWIAMCALGMSLQTQLLLNGSWKLDALAGFIFASTLFLYAIHRIVGMRKVRPFAHKGRYRVIASKRLFILALGAIGGLAAGIFFLLLPRHVQLWLIPAALLSLAYVLPVFGNRRRLRDFHFFKIFLIALVWAWVSVLLPAAQMHMEGFVPVWIMFLERTFFILAITIPFDIRDLQVDRYTGVLTIPGRWGVRTAKGIGFTALLSALLFSALNWQLEVYATPVFLMLTLSFLLSALVLHGADRIKHDYYFTGLADGLMLIQFLLVLGAHSWLV